MSKINYDEIMSLGFNEDNQTDSNYYAEHGFEYAIITKKLTKRIYLDWAKETKLCKIVRTNKCHDILKQTYLHDLESVKNIINFFTN